MYDTVFEYYCYSFALIFVLISKMPKYFDNKHHEIVSSWGGNNIEGNLRQLILILSKDLFS